MKVGWKRNTDTPSAFHTESVPQKPVAPDTFQVPVAEVAASRLSTMSSAVIVIWYCAVLPAATGLPLTSATVLTVSVWGVLGTCAVVVRCTVTSSASRTAERTLTPWSMA